MCCEGEWQEVDHSADASVDAVQSHLELVKVSGLDDLNFFTVDGWGCHVALSFSHFFVLSIHILSLPLFLSLSLFSLSLSSLSLSRLFSFYLSSFLPYSGNWGSYFWVLTFDWLVLLIVCFLCFVFSFHYIFNFVH